MPKRDLTSIADLNFFQHRLSIIFGDTKACLGQSQNHVSDNPIPNRQGDQGPGIQCNTGVEVEQIEDLLSRLNGAIAVRKPLGVLAGELEACEGLDRQRNGGVSERRDVI